MDDRVYIFLIIAFAVEPSLFLAGENLPRFFRERFDLYQLINDLYQEARAEYRAVHIEYRQFLFLLHDCAFGPPTFFKMSDWNVYVVLEVAAKRSSASFTSPSTSSMLETPAFFQLW